MVLSVVVVFIFMTSPASAQTSEEQEFDLLGSLSAKYESNGNPGAISNGSATQAAPPTEPISFRAIRTAREPLPIG